MSADVLLARLEGVQRSGKGWRAQCPACTGRSRKASIAEGDDGRVLLHCFAGCPAGAIVEAVGLTLGDLFPERLAEDTPDDRRRRQRAAREIQWGAALEVIQFEARIVAIAAAEIAAGKALSPDDAARVATAAERIADAELVLSDRPQQRARAALAPAQAKAA